MSEITVVHQPEQSRYELHVDGRLAGFVRYRPHADHVEFLHTEVDPEFEGQGLGNRLAALRPGAPGRAPGISATPAHTTTPAITPPNSPMKSQPANPMPQP